MLNKVLKESAICKKCKHKQGIMQVFEDQKARKGLAEKLVLKCSNCTNKIVFFTSENTVSCKGTRGFKPFDVNVRSVHCSQTIGHAGLSKFCAGMDLPPPVNKSVYNRLQKMLSEKSVEQAEKVMHDASQRLFNVIMDEEPENIAIINNKMVAAVAVSIDGTWQRRGHCSKNRVVFLISIVTGEVIDYEVRSLFCRTCEIYERKYDKESIQYKTFFENHKFSCSVNHHGSSDSMESEGACDMFLRSIDTRALKYSVFVGDGDTGCFGKVQTKLKHIYGDRYVIRKEECVGHIQKRMGSGLREYKRKKRGLKLADGLSVGGRGRLVDKLIDKIQNYYGEAIRNNANDLDGMVNAIWAIYKHIIVDDSQSLEEQHSLCPKDNAT